MLAHFLEFMMLALFGVSWPFAIAKTYRAKRVDGKSPLFEVIVIAGYLCGIASHVVSGVGMWVIGIYAVDILLVSTDLALYCYYSIKNRRAADGGEG
ncbi:MAG: hypothetical protein J6Q49_05470 [Kiritimatiellae bacterium]|jgi:hypothetical protein|nr:hypothetical protein [Kiritimatiellia bacterium]MBQ3746112.1 hypothetical protein [Kiritimatiellia bacterium]